MDYRIQQGVSNELGVLAVSETGLNFCFAVSSCRTLFLCVYDLFGRLLFRADLHKYHVFGNVYSVFVEPLSKKEIYYTVEKDGRIFIDPYTKNVRKLRKWGEAKNRGHVDPAMVYLRDYDWEGDTPVGLDYNDVIAYELHVRGFTRHPSSGVAHRGTYLGLTEKLDYLKGLGITQLVLLPSYSFYEFDDGENLIVSDAAVYSRQPGKASERLNYWGFKDALFMMPKPEYAYSDDFITEFKDMVKSFHRAGIEIVMRFYFPGCVNRNIIIPCLEHWVKEYHIDGFFLMGDDLPINLIITNDVLFDTKIYYEGFKREELRREVPVNSHLAFCGREYMNIARRYLKSDEDMLPSFIRVQADNPVELKRLNYVTAYEGFTLNDLVSYDYKHNEDNGEENRDGENYNYSWNCGAEGPSRKKHIQSLRLKQMKNILIMLMSARGIPMLCAGDEVFNTQYGNNNSYCQDNKISWVVWKDTMYSDEFREFVKELIAFRKAHPIVHSCHEPKMMDYLSCGYPDLSYHSEQAWYPKLNNHIRHIGMMYCGLYAKREDGTDDDFIYIAYNMHWESHEFALPKLPKGLIWEPAILSEKELMDVYSDSLLKKQDNIRVGARSVLILKSRTDTACS